MPTYEYECRTCGHTFEAFQSMSDAPLSSCPECGKSVRRMINGGMGIIFKGSGFYVTDNGKSGKKSSTTAAPAAKSSSESAAKTDAPASTATPAAPAAPKEKAVG